MKILLGTGQVGVNQTNENGRVVLMWAVARGAEHVMKELIKREAINMNTNNERASRLAIAAVIRRETIFEALFAHPHAIRTTVVIVWPALMGTKPVS
jgi:ankyrin repeat protein